MKPATAAAYVFALAAPITLAAPLVQPDTQNLKVRDPITLEVIGELVPEAIDSPQGHAGCGNSGRGRGRGRGGDRGGRGGCGDVRGGRR